MIGILENNQAILKKGRGIFGILFIWRKGLFWNIIKGRVYFAKRLKSGRALKQIEERGVDFEHICPSLPRITTKRPLNPGLTPNHSFNSSFHAPKILRST